MADPSFDALRLAVQLVALTLVLGGLALFVSGGSAALGRSFRDAVEPVLRAVRDRTARSRSELADVTLVVGIVLAVAAAIVHRDPLAGLLAVGVWVIRPSIRRVTREENKVAAVGGHLSIDMMIGLYTPIMLAQFLLANVLLGACLLAVVVALSWPAGGGGIRVPGRRWRPAPVAS